MTSREAALKVLDEVLGKDHRYLNLALKDVHGLTHEDQRFAAALASSTIEHLITIDYILAQFTNVKRASSRVANILRLGVCQLLYMNSVPDSAAVSESVALAGRSDRRIRGYLNGVLRNIARSQDKIRMPDRNTNLIEYLSVVYSYPEWICRLFITQLGPDMAEKLLQYKGVRGRTCLRRTVLAGEQRFPDSEPGIYLDDALYAIHAHSIASDPLILSGAFAVQSEASMLCVRALGLARDARVLDLCAAPGGKSAYAAQIASAGTVTACDLHPHRTDLIRTTAERLKLPNLKAQTWDATVYNDEWKEQFDAVLVDAPCSALGLLYRKPDIRYSRDESDLRSLARTQDTIMKCARRYVKTGGTIVYSTCTIDSIENGEVAGRFLKENTDFVPYDLAKALPGPFADRAVSGSIQLLPPKDDIDGFYIARFTKVSN